MNIFGNRSIATFCAVYVILSNMNVHFKAIITSFLNSSLMSYSQQQQHTVLQNCCRNVACNFTKMVEHCACDGCRCCRAQHCNTCATTDRALNHAWDNSSNLSRYWCATNKFLIKNCHDISCCFWSHIYYRPVSKFTDIWKSYIYMLNISFYLLCVKYSVLLLIDNWCEIN